MSTITSKHDWFWNVQPTFNCRKIGYQESQASTKNTSQFVCITLNYMYILLSLTCLKLVPLEYKLTGKSCCVSIQNWLCNVLDPRAEKLLIRETFFMKCHKLWKWCDLFRGTNRYHKSRLFSLWPLCINHLYICGLFHCQACKTLPCGLCTC